MTQKKRTARAGGHDEFAIIGGQADGGGDHNLDVPYIRAVEAAGRELEIPEPPELPSITLPLERSGGRASALPPKAPFDPEAELEQLRETHAPFLRRLAPGLPFERPHLDLASFDWRVEEGADVGRIDRAFRGEGAWERVAIPHFGPPLGRAVTYYRRTFEVPEALAAPGRVFLCFDGVDYAAEVYVNGNYVGGHEGFFAPFEFDVTDFLRAEKNVLMVRVTNDAIPLGMRSWTGETRQGDKIYAATGPGYDDPEVGWHHCPPGMGIYQGVRLEGRTPQHLHDLFVRPRREDGELDLFFEVWNVAEDDVPVRLSFSIFGRNHEAEVCCDRPVEGIHPAGPWRNTYGITVRAPGLRDWAPEAPWLYELQAVLRDESGHSVDALAQRFGVRSFVVDEGSEPKGRVYFNGGEIRLRGTNTMGHEQQCVMRGDFDQLRDDLLLAKAAHLNFVRLTQRPVQPEVYEYADMLGILLQTDLPLFGSVRRSKVPELLRQASEMERLIRNSPASVLVSYINEPFPKARGKPERNLLRDEMERFFAAADEVVRLENPDRMIKHVDGDYDPPDSTWPDNHCYNTWYNGHAVQLGKLHQGWWQEVRPGWMYACGEFGAEGLDPVDFMRRRCPADWLPGPGEDEAEWTPERIPKCQTGRFHYLWFEARERPEDWMSASQAHQAWGTRLMTEAFRRDNRMNAFAVHLLIDAFPCGWMKSLMDCERRPKAGYFAYREACAPRLPHFRTDRFAFFCGEAIPLELWLCNDTPEIHEGSELVYEMRGGDGTVIAGGQVPARAAAVAAVFQGRVCFPGVEAEARQVLRLETAWVGADGALLGRSGLDLAVFPFSPPRLEGRARIMGAPGGKAARLATALGLTAFYEGAPSAADRILVDDPAAFAEAEAAVAEAVCAGARCIFLGLAPGRYGIAGDTVDVEACSLNSRHCADRNTGHPAVEGLAPEDLKFLYDEDEGCASPFLHAVFDAPGWQRILKSGNQGDGEDAGAWRPVLAAAEKTEGEGRWIICQIDLHNRVRTNPAVARIARGLLSG